MVGEKGRGRPPGIDRATNQVNAETNIYTDGQGREWAPVVYFYKKYGISYHNFDKYLDLENTSKMEGKDSGGRDTILYDVRQTSIALEKYTKLPKVDKDTGVYTDNEGLRWAPYAYFREKFGIKTSRTDLLGQVPTIQGLHRVNKKTTLYSLREGEKVVEDYVGRSKGKPLESILAEQLPPRIDQVSGTYTDSERVQWAPAAYFIKTYNLSYSWLDPRLGGVPTIPGRSGNGQRTIFYRLDNVKKLIDDHLRLQAINEETKLYVDSDGTAWAPIVYFLEKYKIKDELLKRFIKDAQSITGRFSGGEVTLYKAVDVEKPLESVLRLPHVSDGNNVYQDGQGRQWAPPSYFVEEYGISTFIFSKYVQGVSVMDALDDKGKVAVLYPIDDIAERMKEIIELPEVDEETRTLTDLNGRKWGTTSYFTTKHSLEFSTFTSLTEGLPTIKGRMRSRSTILYPIEESEKAIEEFVKLPQANVEGTYTSLDGSQWAVTTYFLEKFGVSYSGISLKLKDAASIEGRSNIGSRVTLYNVEQLNKLLEQSFNFPKVDSENGVYRDENAVEWAPTSYFQSRYPVDYSFVQGRKGSVPHIKGRVSNGQTTVLFNVKEMAKIIESYLALPEVGADGVYTDQAGQKWASLNYFYDTYGASWYIIQKNVEKIGTIEGRTGDGVANKLYNVADTEAVMTEWKKIPETNNAGLYADESGETWATIPYLMKHLQFGRSAVETKLVDARSMTGRPSSGPPTKLYRVLDAEAAFSDLREAPRTDQDRIYTDGSGQRWAPFAYFSEKFGLGNAFLKAREDKLKKISGIGRHRKISVLYNVNELETEIEKFLALPQADKEGRYLDPAGEVWLTITCLQDTLGIHSRTILTRASDIPTIAGRTKKNKETTLYNFSKAREALESFTSLPEANEEGLFLDQQGMAWATTGYFIKKLKTTYQVVKKRINDVEYIYGRHIGIQVRLYKVNSLVAKIEEVARLPEVDLATGIYTDEAGGGWVGVQFFVEKFGIDHARVAEILGKLTTIAARGKRKVETVLFKLQEAEPIVEEYLRVVEAKRGSAEQEQKLKESVIQFVKEVSGDTTDTAGESSDDSKRFRSLIGILGGSRCLDLLYKFRPGYRGLPVEYIKGIIAEYLGDFLITTPPFDIDDVEVAIETNALSELTFRQGLYETFKDNCLRYYFEKHREGETDSSKIIYGYLDHITDALKHLQNKDLDDVIQDVIVYYDSVLKDFHKPEGFVNTLSSDREFPDINQRINMKELSDKKRLLIADEMGLGKSASVIMAKEQLGVQCALIVAPSNVLDTWQQYLSEENPSEPKKGGYFKKGQTPRVLRVESASML